MSMFPRHNDPSPRFGDGNWTLDELQHLIQCKITERTARATIEKQDAYKLFGRPADGITPRHFRKQLRKWGIKLSSKENDIVFRHFDVTGSGTITFQELVERLMPKDYTSKTWNILRDEANDQERRAAGKHSPTVIWTAKDLSVIEKRIQQKILERTGHSSTEVLDAFKVFGRPKVGITKEIFAEKLLQFGLQLPQEALDALYAKYDPKNQGAVPFREFIERVMPKDYTEKLWSIESAERTDRMYSDQKAKKNSKETSHAVHFPPSLRNHRWTLDEIEKQIQQKITSKTFKPNVEKKDAFKLFDRPKAGITPKMFKQQLQKFGIYLSPEEIDKLFQRYDKSQSGDITFQEFIAAVMPQDYPEPACLPHTAPTASSVCVRRRQAAEIPSDFVQKRWSLDEMERLLQDKIRAFTPNPNVAIQDAYKLFGRPEKGITVHVFRNKLKHFGMPLNEEESQRLFNRYDKDGSGIIHFHEFVSGVMEKDYVLKPWNVVRDEEIQKLRQQTAKSKRHHRKSISSDRRKHEKKYLKQALERLELQDKIIDRPRPSTTSMGQSNIRTSASQPFLSCTGTKLY